MNGRDPSSAPPAALIERRFAVPFLLVTSLFFAWAFAAQLNDVLIRQFQLALDLTRGQAGFIQTAFYAGYFFGAMPAALFMSRYGYKAGILAGLGLYCIGALAFYPAAELRAYAIFLAALYAIAFGLSFLETAANPYVNAMGPRETAAARINLAQGFYGIGAFLGPFVGATFILSDRSGTPITSEGATAAQLEVARELAAKAVQGPYLAVAAAVACLAVLFALSRFPPMELEEKPEGAAVRIRDLLHHRTLIHGAIAQAFYVGAQVAIFSFFIDFVIEADIALSEADAAYLLSIGFLALMVGRFSGAFLLRRVRPASVLGIYCGITLCLLTIAMATAGAVSVASLWFTTFFMSIIFPTIFSMGIQGLGPLTKLGSSIMIMAIIGGAIAPPVMGWIADATGSLRIALFVPALGFGVVLLYALTYSPTPQPRGAS